MHMHIYTNSFLPIFFVNPGEETFIRFTIWYELVMNFHSPSVSESLIYSFHLNKVL